MSEQIINLEGLSFFAYHGVNDEEQVIGNRYEVDLSVWMDFTEAAKEDNINKTADYGHLYEIVARYMQKKSRLLEHIAHNINEAVLEELPLIKKVKCKVSKMNPPIGGVCTKSSVVYEKVRS